MEKQLCQEIAEVKLEFHVQAQEMQEEHEDRVSVTECLRQHGEELQEEIDELRTQVQAWRRCVGARGRADVAKCR